MISGASGDAGYYSDVGDELADVFTVINYDRRGNSRSTGRTHTQMKMSDQVEDAKELIDCLAGGQAIVFGNSGGAIFALEPAARFPKVIQALIAHEPPAVRVLPNSDPRQAGKGGSHGMGRGRQGARLHA